MLFRWRYASVLFIFIAGLCVSICRSPLTTTTGSGRTMELHFALCLHGSITCFIFIKQRSTLFSPIQRPFLGTDWNHSVYSLINDEMLWSVIQARLIEEETSYGTSSPTANYPPRSINFALEGQSSPLWIPTLRRKGISSILIHRWLAILISSFAGILSGKSVLGNFRVITLYSSGRLTVQIISCKYDVLRPFVSASFTCIVISIIRNYWFCLFDLIWILKAEIFLNSWNFLIYVYN